MKTGSVKQIATTWALNGMKLILNPEHFSVTFQVLVAVSMKMTAFGMVHHIVS
jgi:hypothetical protein